MNFGKNVQILRKMANMTQEELAEKMNVSRIKAGYVYVRNPMNPHRISKVSLSPDLVDGIVFH